MLKVPEKSHTDDGPATYLQILAYGYLAFFLLLPLWLIAQGNPVRYLDIDSGLSNNSVTAIYQDKNGFMWFGTYDGLNRYDGYEFKIYRNSISDTTSLANNYIYCLEGDTANRLWVGGANGASVLDQTMGTFQPLYYHSPLTRQKTQVKEVVQIKSINRELVIIGAQKSGLLVFEKGSHVGSQIKFPGVLQNPYCYGVTALEYVPGEQYCWVFIEKIGLFRYDIRSKKLTAAERSITQAGYLKSCNNGTLWIGTEEGLYLYNTQAHTLSSNFMPNKCVVNQMVADTNGDLWIATDGHGVHILKKGSAKAVPLTQSGESPLLKSNVVESIYEDIEGNKWFGTLRGGISMLSAAPWYFKHIIYHNRYSADPTENFILSFGEDKRENVWIGTDGAGLRYWDRQHNTYTTYSRTAPPPNRISSNFITAIERDANDAIWFSTWGGGVEMIDAKGNIKNFKCFNTATRKEEKNVWLVFEDVSKTMWASAVRGGTLFRFNKQKEAFEVFDPTITDILCLAQTKDGMLWGGNYTEIVAIDPFKGQHHFFPVGYPIRCILEDAQRNLWIGTSDGGLLLFNRDTGAYRRYTVDDGMPSNTVLRLLEDKIGNLWLSTYNGLSRFDPNKKTFRNFLASDGLQSNQFSYNAGLMLSTGEFLFGGIKGFNVFYPNSISDTGHTAKLLLTGIAVNNANIGNCKKYITGQHLGKIKSMELPFDQTTLSLDFVGLHYNNADKIQYAYYLEGWDEHWNCPGKSRKANYTHLHEGTYKFKVKTADLYGKWGKPTDLLTVTVLPPWYRTWWAYVLYGCMASLLIYSYLRYNRYKERLRYEVRLAQVESIKEKELA